MTAKYEIKMVEGRRSKVEVIKYKLMTDVVSTTERCKTPQINRKQSWELPLSTFSNWKTTVK